MFPRHVIVFNKSINTSDEFAGSCNELFSSTISKDVSPNEEIVLKLSLGISML
jgi:hypothetical protein